MATIAQGQLAGQLANGLVNLAAFSQALTALVTASGQITQISISTKSQIAPTVFIPPAALTIADSATLLNELITLAGQLTSEWTAQLGGL